MGGVFGVVEPATPDILKLGRMLRSLRRDRSLPMFKSIEKSKKFALAIVERILSVVRQAMMTYGSGDC